MPDQNQNGPISYNMAPYSGPWTKVEAGHLLRRTVFGPTNQQMLTAVSDGMATTVTNLLQIPVVAEPITFHPDEAVTAFGNSWVNDVFPSSPTDAATTATARNLSLAVWLMKGSNEGQSDISQKMCMFWHNHFAVTAVADPRATYDYFALIRQHALGNFRQFVKDMTINPAMLLFLNGNTNTLFSPNENFARELLELYTVGKGPQIGPGDYTNYKEEDVAAGAKILTGYLVDGIGSDTLTDVSAVYTDILHDPSTKTLSSHFGGATVSNNMGNEYSDYIDIIFQQQAVAEYISRKLYRYFVNYDLTTDVETNVIPIMAATMIANNYDILPVMSELLSSEHFYDISVRGALIKSPVDMTFSMFNSTESIPGFDIVSDAEMYLLVYQYITLMGQEFAAPPSVAGWPAYYQTPAYSQLWVNSALLKARFQLTDFMTYLTGIPGGGNNWELNTLAFLDNLSFPSDAPSVIDDIADLFTPKGMSATQKLILKAVLTNGLPDFEWTIQYNDYQANLGNTTFSDPVKQRVLLVLQQVFHMPEFQTI
ncbi:MAG: DUF1800 family protein [Crocinitomicaceae bacterium]|nr:DUF1800 family protein [Crocinitomicaceae bacterium]